MASFGLLSPSQTQSPSFISPVEELRNWLASRGFDAKIVDDLRRKHDQRAQNIENEQQFLTHLQAIVKTTPTGPHHLQKNELNQIETSLASLTSDTNTQLHKASNAEGKKICIDALLLLPVDKRVAFLSFINNDTVNDRLRFIKDVMPFLVGKLSPGLAVESEAKDKKQTLSPNHASNRSCKQRLHISGEGGSFRETKIPRRSQRIKNRLYRQGPMSGDGKRKRSSKRPANG